MSKFAGGFIFILLSLSLGVVFAGPIEVESPSNTDDLGTSETFGYGYYRPPVYSRSIGYYPSPLAPVTSTVPVSTKHTNALISNSAASARSDYGYAGGYKYGGGYGYGSRWGSGSGSSVNEFYRRHPVYVAWG